MALDRATLSALARDPGARRIVGSWRALTGGRRVRDDARATLVACSGGADSSALALALSTAGASLVVAHVVHDWRPRDQALADRDAAAGLARLIGAQIVHDEVTARAEGGNLEAACRRLRYAALVARAREHSCPFVATGHHAQDQLETMLMRLVRGAGPSGLRGLRASRNIGGVSVVRPMLGVSRADAERICGLAGWSWREDATNLDASRLRARIRAGVVPALLDAAPASLARVGACAELLAELDDLVRQRVAALEAIEVRRDGAIVADRARLAAETPAVVGAWVRRAAGRLVGERGADRRAYRAIRPIALAVCDQGRHERVFEVRGVRVRVDAVRVEVRPARTPVRAP